MNPLAPDTRYTHPPLVSVVIPAFNACRTLAQALDSVRAQTYPNIEIIVVDDGSTDGTADVLRAYAESVRSIHQPNGGLPNARNTGCRSARGEFIALMDADDLCTPERITVQAGVMQCLPEAVLCCSDFASFNHNGLVASSHGETYYSMIEDAADGLSSLYPERGKFEIATKAGSASPPPIAVDAHFGRVYRELVHGNFVHPPTVMFRRGALETAGIFDETLRYTCDWEWMVRMARIGPFIHVNRPMLEYRLSETQMSSKRHNGEGAVDIVHAAMKIRRSDPDLMATDRDRMRMGLGEFCHHAADALAERRKANAVRMLARSVWEYGTIKSETVRTALKILMPFSLIQFVRRLRTQASGFVVAMPVPEGLGDSLLSCTKILAPFII